MDVDQDVMLTTVDNPYDPFTQFDDWYNWDTTNGYNTCAYLARVALTSDSLSELDNSLAIVQAMDDIIAEHNFGTFKKVKNPKVNN
jgi:hypothetical protein